MTLHKIYSPVACPLDILHARPDWLKQIAPARPDWLKECEHLYILRRVIWVGVVRILRKHCPEVRYHRFYNNVSRCICHKRKIARLCMARLGYNSQIRLNMNKSDYIMFEINNAYTLPTQNLNDI